MWNAASPRSLGIGPRRRTPPPAGLSVWHLRQVRDCLRGSCLERDCLVRDCLARDCLVRDCLASDCPAGARRRPVEAKPAISGGGGRCQGDWRAACERSKH